MTGGAGFIGSHLCERLLSEGNEVYCLDNLITGHRHNVAHLLPDGRFHFVLHDVVEQLAEEMDVEAIYHLASPASPPDYLRHPVQTALANSQGTYRMLELARKRAAKFLFASTSEAYGDPLEHPQREEYWGNVNPNGQRSCYDESKRFGEALTFTYVREFGLDARIVRIFNTYGPRSDPEDGRIVPNFVTQALRGDPITVYGDGQQTRSLCYVSDLVDGLVRAQGSAGTKGGVFNLGNPDEHTVLQFAEIIKRETGSSSPITFRPLVTQDDPTRRKPDITRARERLGWEPRVPLAEGLARTIAWFKERLAT
ncbi:MAG: SDR family oxidoreductase [Dehalococcoidales bacterium]|nr:SDR family oxidoreductase [Dehalococcoidales bacterium]